jgi:hypothetical protein
MLQSVFPTGRFFGRKTKKRQNKNISGGTNLRLNFGRIFQEKGRKRSQILEMYVMPFFHYSIENLEFSQISILVWLQNVV